VDVAGDVGSKGDKGDARGFREASEARKVLFWHVRVVHVEQRHFRFHGRHDLFDVWDVVLGREEPGEVVTLASVVFFELPPPHSWRPPHPARESVPIGREHFGREVDVHVQGSQASEDVHGACDDLEVEVHLVDDGELQGGGVWVGEDGLLAARGGGDGGGAACFWLLLLLLLRGRVRGRCCCAQGERGEEGEREEREEQQEGEGGERRAAAIAARAACCCCSC
jgi:hypothetical protein